MQVETERTTQQKVQCETKVVKMEIKREAMTDLNSLTQPTKLEADTELNSLTQPIQLEADTELNSLT